MIQLSLEKADITIQELIKKAMDGEEIIFIENKRPVAKITSYRGGFGSAKDVIKYISDDFNETPEGFEEYMQ